MSKERGRKKNYSNRNHNIREIRRKKDPFEANSSRGFPDSTTLNSKGNDNITSEITDMSPGKEYPID